MSEVINLNDTSPAPPSSAINARWQKGAQTGTDAATGLPVFPVSANIPFVTGDSGSGGAAGVVPPPAAGDAAAGKVLGAGGSFVIPQLVIGWFVPAGSAVAATGAGPIHVAPRPGSLTKAKLAVIAADSSVALTVRIRKNGTSIFSTDWSVPALASAGSLWTLTPLVSSPVAVATDDLFTMDIVAGSASWAFTLQVE